MRGASGAIGVPEAAVRALIAGNDLLCVGGEFPKSPGAKDLIEATVAAIVGAVHSGRLALEQLELAAARTARLGRHPVVDAADPAGPDQLGLAAARRAVRVEGSLPSGDALVIQLEAAATVAAGEVPWGLAPQLSSVERLDAAVAGHPGTVNAILARAHGRPLVIVSRDTHRHPWARSLVDTLSVRHPMVVLVEMGWPAAWRPAGTCTYLATYGASRANAAVAAELLWGAVRTA